MPNPFAELYPALWAVLADSEDVRAVADIVSQTAGGIETPRRKLDEPERIRAFLVPQPRGTVESISSTHTRVVENFAVVANGGFVSHADALALKWAIIKALWAKRGLGLAFVERTDVDAVVRRPAVGTSVLGDKGVTWSVEILIHVTMYFDRTDLPMS